MVSMNEGYASGERVAGASSSASSDQDCQKPFRETHGRGTDCIFSGSSSSSVSFGGLERIERACSLRRCSKLKTEPNFWVCWILSASWRR